MDYEMKTGKKDKQLLLELFLLQLLKRNEKTIPIIEDRFYIMQKVRSLFSLVLICIELRHFCVQDLFSLLYQYV